MSREVGGVASDEARYRRAFERVPFGIVIAELGVGPRIGTIVDVNPALCAMVGYERAELVGHVHAQLHHFLRRPAPVDLRAFRLLRRDHIVGF